MNEAPYQTRCDELAEMSAADAFREAGFLLFELLRERTAAEAVSFPNHYTRIIFLERNEMVSAETARSARWLGLRWRLWREDQSAFTPTERHKQRAIDCVQDLIKPGSEKNGASESAEAATEDATDTPDADAITDEPNAPRPNALRAVFLEKADAHTLLCSAEEYGNFLLELPKHLDYLRALVWPMVRLNLFGLRHLGGQRFTIRDEGFAVLEPDVLFNASALGQLCAGGPQARLHFFNQLLPRSEKDIFFRGTVVNQALDLILRGEPITARSLLRGELQKRPIVALVLNDAKLAKYEGDLAIHCQTMHHPNVLRLAGSSTLALEPTFISPAFGLMGRLDALDTPVDERPSIVELKSSRPPQNRNLRQSDEFQCLAYSLIIESTELGQARSVSILYSGTPPEIAEGPLRAAVAGHREQASLLELRNQAVFIEKQLAENPRKMYDAFSPAKYGTGHYDEKRDALHDLKDDWARAPELARAFVAEFTGFAAREHRCEWLGNPGSMANGGQSRMWNVPPEVRVQDGYLLSGLTLQDGDAATELTLKLPESSPGDRFEPGTNCVLYHGDQPAAGIHIKGRVFARNADTIMLRVQERPPTHLLARSGTWSIETDLIGSGLGRNLASIRAVLDASPERDRYLGIRAPRAPVPIEVRDEAELLTPHQEQVAGLALGAPDYFLIQGPPGTGKTRHVVRTVVQQALRLRADERIVCLAYTNRAVQEMADTLQKAGADFILLGRAAPDHLRPHLITQRAKGQSLSEIKHLFASARVLLATTATWLGSRTVWKLGFTLAIIDEASQLLEPHVAAILCDVPRFILIGDQNQLPAVVQQSAATRTVSSPELAADFHQLGDSVFLRLWRMAGARGWPVTAQLTEQGRMHKDIMAFPNAAFYGGTLTTLTPSQNVDGPVRNQPGESPLDQFLAERRIAFVNVPATIQRRTSTVEARCLGLMVERLVAAGVEPEEIGIICPYRAQIQTIRSALPPALRDRPTVDTVERFQGSTRDVILVSFTIRDAGQLQHIQTMDAAEVVDRKLNVALTRARSQCILLGHQGALSGGKALGKLLQWLDEQNAIVQWAALADPS